MVLQRWDGLKASGDGRPALDCGAANRPGDSCARCSSEYSSRWRYARPRHAQAPKASGACAQLRQGTNTLKFKNQTRRMDLYMPRKPTGAPVLFIWHGLRDKPANMARWFGAQALAITHGAIVVVPHSSGQFTQSEWGFTGGKPEVDADFFDEALACLHRQFKTNLKRIYTTGFSAGGLWSTWLVMHRSHRIAAAAVFSGGVGVFFTRHAQHDVPVLAVHGGLSDVFGAHIDFSQMTELVWPGKPMAIGHLPRPPRPSHSLPPRRSPCPSS